METGKILFFIFLFLSAASEAAGFWQTPFIQLKIGSLIPLLSWILAGKRYPGPCLFLSVLLAAAGLALGVSRLCMFAFALFSIALWDLALTERSLPSDPEDHKYGLYRLVRLESLITVLGAGLLVTIAGNFLKFKSPFYFMIIAIFFACFSFERFIKIIKNRS